MDRVIEPIDVSDHSNIDSWFERFHLYAITNSKINNNNKVAYLLTYLGKDAYNLLRDLAFPSKPSDLSVSKIQNTLLEHIKPKNYITQERAIFNSMIRKSEQPVKEFI